MEEHLNFNGKGQYSGFYRREPSAREPPLICEPLCLRPWLILNRGPTVHTYTYFNLVIVCVISDGNSDRSSAHMNGELT